jgi:hypothetical protein
MDATTKEWSARAVARRLGRAASWVPWAVVVGVALWFRVTSLEGLTPVDGDEAFWGIQASHLLAGKAVATTTVTGNPLNLAMVGLEAPLVWLFGPQLWVLRAPTAAAGVLVAVLAYVWGRRWTDRPTALVAATALAVLPAAILISRKGLENGLVPLFALLTLHQAFLGRRVGTLLAFVGSLSVHPTALFLGPVAAAVYLGKVLPQVERPRRRRVLLEVAIGSAAVLAGFGLVFLRRGGSAGYYQVFYRPPDGPAFAQAYGRFLYGKFGYHMQAIRGPRLWAHDAVFWGAVAACLAGGIPGLVRRRRWDHLALVASLPPSLAAFHRMAGPGVFDTAFARYAAPFLVPTVLAFAVLARRFFLRRDGAGGAVGVNAGPVRFRRAAVAAGLTVAAVLLAEMKTYTLDGLDPTGRDSVWTFRAESAGVHREIYDRIARDVARSPAPGRVRGVLVDSFWTGKPLEYLASARRDLRVVNLDELYRRLPPRDHAGYLARRLLAGDYLVTKSRLVFELEHRAREQVYPKLAALDPPRSVDEEVRAAVPAGLEEPWVVGEFVIHHRGAGVPAVPEVARQGTPDTAARRTR